MPISKLIGNHIKWQTRHNIFTFLHTISFSTNLERIGVTVLAKLFTVETFGMGATNAFFHAEGGLPILSVLFTKLAITQANSTAQCLKIQSVYYQILVVF